MTHRVSIITATYGPKADYLADTVQSVRDQQLPEGWELEWLIQEDGAQPRLADAVNGLPGVHYAANHAQVGSAATRNFALARATGELIQVLDHDDMLLPGALATLVPRFDDPQLGWAVGQADDLMPDGARRTYESALPFGPIAPGAVNDWAIEHAGNWPIHCAGLMLRTNLVRALGGWVASPIDEDVIMFSAMSELVPGYNDPATTWLYRQHAQQTSKTETSQRHSPTARRIALQRIEALSTVGLRLPTQAAPPRNLGEAEVGPAAKDAVDPGVAWWKQ